jgi:hypothetical protein
MSWVLVCTLVPTLSFLSPLTFPVVVETINPTANGLFTLVVWFFCIKQIVDNKHTLVVWFLFHPRLGHRAQPWTISSPTSLVFDIKESTTRTAFFWLSFPTVLPSIYLSRVVCLPLFGRLLAICVCLFLFFTQQHTQPPLPPFHHMFSHVPGTNPLTVNHVKLQTCHYHFTHPHRPSTRQFGALETGHQPGSARHIRRMGRLRVPVRLLRRRSLGSPQHSPWGPLRARRPDFPEPAALAVGANPAARDAFKRATESRAASLACSASFMLAILDSIGEANRLAI